ncbi:F-box/kelch-repeat protein [Pyrus ussuriensis x Pyrus communis]|uniref:F-box/kelch-repeat protein n=1 Tax=Pyrus ussuriensis x Pyrus communis TaxID=2448454 RepID=A0A5N5IDF9_9ROSA|nr:F-box/kelch-repeat protein [Pyrus ussuriensis x Pyrus communis]
MESKSLHYYPEDIVHEILLRLPVKSLMRFSVVCKSWSFRTKSSAFIYNHLISRRRAIQLNNENPNEGGLLIVQSYDPTLYSLCWDNPTSYALSTYTELMNTFVGYKNIHTQGNGIPYKVLGTCYNIVIRNPSIRKFFVVPKPTIPFSRYDRTYYAFGYDSHSNDYKLLRSVMTCLTSRGIEIWSLVRGSWRSLSADISIFHPSVLPRFSVVFSPCGWPPALVNDALHWSRLQKNMNHFILSFDMCSELFGVIILPEVA